MRAVQDNRVNHWWHQRHLVWEFLKRDLQARYIGSAMGFYWSIINPLILLTLYTVVFGLILHVRVQERFGEGGLASFALYIFCGLLPWFALQEAIVRSTTCVVDNAHLIRQVRFPAKVLPAFLVLSSIVNQMIGTVVLLVALPLLGTGIPMSVLLLPVVLILQALICFGLGLMFATLHTYLRDVGQMVGIGLMVCMWMTPLFYSLDIVQEQPLLRTIILFNPFTHFIEMYHQIFLSSGLPEIQHWIVLTLTAICAVGLGYRIFTSAHDEFADVL